MKLKGKELARRHHYNRISNPELKGRIGERQIYNQLKFFEAEGARFIGNCYVPMSNGKTCEIDLLMIARSGIFVIESKNYSGWIFGHENSKEWMQSLPNGTRNQFYNPLMQNKAHLYALKNIIGNNYPMHSVVVFSDRCELKSIEYSTKNGFVTQQCDLARYAKNIDTINENKLTESDINRIFELLWPFCIVSQTIKEKHIYDISRDDSNNVNNAIDIWEELTKRCKIAVTDSDWKTARILYDYIVSKGHTSKDIVDLKYEILNHFDDAKISQYYEKNKPTTSEKLFIVDEDISQYYEEEKNSKVWIWVACIAIPIIVVLLIIVICCCGYGLLATGVNSNANYQNSTGQSTYNYYKLTN